MPIARTESGGGKNYTLRVVGWLDEEQPLCVADFSGSAQLRGLRLDRASWLIQEKAGLLVTWDMRGAPDSLLLVCESRNGINFAPGVNPPGGWEKQIWLHPFGLARVPDPPAHFTLTLDFDRQ